MIDSRKELATRITKGILSSYPLIYIVGRDEDRIAGILSSLASHQQGYGRLISWTLSRGFSDTHDCRDPLEAVERIRQRRQAGFFLLKDFPDCFSGNPTLIRAMRDLYYDLKKTGITVFLSHPTLIIPGVLNKEIFLVNLGLPSEIEIRHFLESYMERRGGGKLIQSDSIGRLSTAMLGLTIDEIGHLLTRFSRMRNLDEDAALNEIYEDKIQVLEKESCLQYVRPEYSLEQIGGLNNLKQWVLKRIALFSEKAFASGLPLPSGLLLMGVSGCGKSMAAKTIASAWKLPLVRLDMSLVLSGTYGAPESAFRNATRVAEEMAPVVLWIDELESSFGYDEGTLGSGNINIFSSFLTWMQDKPANVFLAATANRIQLLPAELIRKGRFDQLFFLDLPGKDDRIEIIKIHIERQGQNPADFDLGYLAALTREWSGAEIEQAVISARVDAYQEGRGFTEQDISHNTSQMVPLAKTMKEQIKAIKDWSRDRAISAS